MKISLHLTIYVLCLSMMASGLQASTVKKIGFWGTWNIPCGIAMYTKHVVNSLLKMGYRVTNYDHRFSPELIVVRAVKDALDIITIQYDDSIMPPKDVLISIIQRLKNAGIKVVITMHAEPEYAQELVNAAHCTIYHKQPHRLYDLSKVAVFPMGVPVFNPAHHRMTLRQKYGFSESDKILVSTGFMLPSKEIHRILEYLAPAIKRDPLIKVQLLHSLTSLSLQVSEHARNYVVAIINKYKLHDQVILITRFISQEELSERIHLSDLGYQWFYTDTHGTSATAKEYISAWTPLIIPDFSHFHDIHYHGIKVTPRDHGAFVQTILSLLYQPQRLAIMRRHLYRLYEQLNYDTIIKKYDAVFQSL